MDAVVAAAVKANAHDFIVSLPQGYDTQVGQRQRISIARAILRNPAIMLLDEATSALDNASEAAVQAALEAACTDVTTVTIAHRLTTVENADYVAVVDSGRVLEFGPHNQILKNNAAAILEACKEETEKSTHLPKLVHESEGSIQKETEPKPAAIEEKLEHYNKASFMQLVKLNRSEWKQACLGVIFALGMGLITPVSSVMNAIAIAAIYTQGWQELRHTVTIAVSISITVSVLYFTFATLEHYYFGVMGAWLTRKIRENMLNRILQFEVGWFDQQENSTGFICSRLATDASLVRSLAGDRMYLIVETVASVLVCLVISFSLSWRQAAVVTAVQPLVAFSYYLRMAKLKGVAKKTATVQQTVSHIATDAVSQHRTVTAYCLHENIQNMLTEALNSSKRTNLVTAQVAGLTLGVSLFLLYSTYGLSSGV